MPETPAAGTLEEEARQRALEGQRQWARDVALVLVTLALKDRAMPDPAAMVAFQAGLQRLAQFAGIAWVEDPRVVPAGGDYTKMGKPGGVN